MAVRSTRPWPAEPRVAKRPAAKAGNGSALRAPKFVRVGTDFSGMDAPVLALTELKVRCDHRWACDNNAICRKFIESTTHPVKIFQDVTSRDMSDVDEVDAYFFSPPCQPFSTAGNGKGEKDERGRLVKQSLSLIRAKRPRLAIMENVAALGSRHKRTLRKIVRMWQELGYKVSGKILRTEQHGIPHRRKRIFLVGVRKDSLKRAFTWPEPIPLKFKAMQLIDRSDHKAGNSAKLPTTKMARQRVKSAYKKIIKVNGVNPRRRFCAIDVDCGVKFQSIGIDLLPCLTATRGRSMGFWLTPVGRRIRVNEMFKFQGFNDRHITQFKESGIPQGSMGAMLGNGLSLNVYGRVLGRALWAAGLVATKPKDHWEPSAPTTEAAAP